MIILDIETQELIPESRDLSQLRISVAGVLNPTGTQMFTEEELTALFTLLDDADLIVGHNLLAFDYQILQRYAPFDVRERYRTKTFDMLHILLRKTDRKISLNDLARRNLGIEKLGSGKDAPQLFKEGKHEELRQYLTRDLEITLALFEHIKNHGKLRYGHIVYKDPIEREVSIEITER